MHRILIQIRDVFSMLAHFGWAHAFLSLMQGQVHKHQLPGSRFFGSMIGSVLARFDRYTQSRTAEFDATHGTETYKRLGVPVTSAIGDKAQWGYGAVNPDFFREIMQSISVPLSDYVFVDVGSGKGAAVFVASEFPFRRLAGVELTADLVEIAKRNTVLFNKHTGKNLAPEWIQADFFKWRIPNEPQLFFFNNPFPAELSVTALEVLERSLIEHPRPALLVFRKAPQAAGDHMHRSRVWTPLRLAPYWRVYRHG